MLLVNHTEYQNKILQYEILWFMAQFCRTGNFLNRKDSETSVPLHSCPEWDEKYLNRAKAETHNAQHCCKNWVICFNLNNHT